MARVHPSAWDEQSVRIAEIELAVAEGRWAEALADAEGVEAGNQIDLYKQQVAAYQARLNYLGSITSSLMKQKESNDTRGL